MIYLPEGVFPEETLFRYRNTFLLTFRYQSDMILLIVKALTERDLLKEHRRELAVGASHDAYH